MTRLQCESILWPTLAARPMWVAAMEYRRRNPDDPITDDQAREAERRALKKIAELMTSQPRVTTHSP